MSTMMTLSTVLCLSTSLAVAPSPPPLRGAGGTFRKRNTGRCQDTKACEGGKTGGREDRAIGSPDEYSAGVGVSEEGKVNKALVVDPLILLRALHLAVQ